MTVVMERDTGRRKRRVIVRAPEPAGRCECCGADLEVEPHFADCLKETR
jgi:hypothetical protein